MLLRGVLMGALLIAALWSGTPARAAGSCPDMTVVTTAATAAAAAVSTLCLINAVRADQGLRPVRWNARLALAGLQHSDDQIAHSYFSHASWGGGGPLERIRAAGYLRRAAGWRLGETIGAGFEAASTPLSIVTAWLRSPEHRAILLDRRFREVGVGVATAVKPGAGGRGAVFTADFGRLAR